MRKIIRCIFVFCLLNFNLFSQSSFQTWPTIALSGKLQNDLEIKFKYRSKYDHSENESSSSWFNMGLVYNYQKFNIGLFYRELNKGKLSSRKTEKRPYFDLSYKINDNNRFRLRNSFRIIEGKNNIFRQRARYLYSLRKWKKVRPFILNEIFLSKKKLDRNRVAFGSDFKINKKINFKPSYIIEFFRDVDEMKIEWTNRSALLLTLDIEI